MIEHWNKSAIADKRKRLLSQHGNQTGAEFETGLKCLQVF